MYQEASPGSISCCWVEVHLEEVDLAANLESEKIYFQGCPEACWCQAGVVWGTQDCLNQASTSFWVEADLS